MLNIGAEPNEYSEAKNMMVEQCPDPKDRTLVLKRLISTADTASSIAPDAWAVTLFSNGFRLNIGQVEAVIFIDGQLRINLVGSLGEKPFMGRCFRPEVYRSLPPPLCSFNGTIDQYRAHHELIERAHQRFIELAATTSSGAPRKGTPFRRSHCEGLIQYARNVLREPSA